MSLLVNIYRERGVVAEKQGNAISFGGIPTAATFFFLQIFLKRAAKPSAGTFSGTLLNLTWLHQSLRQNLLRNAVEPDLALHESLSDLHRNLLRNPVEPDLALHQSLPDLLRNLRNLFRNFVESDPAPAPVHTGVILG